MRQFSMSILSVAFVLTAVATPAKAQTNDGYVKIVNSWGTDVFHDVDSITLSRPAVSAPPIDEWTTDDVRTLIKSVYPEQSLAMTAEMSADNLVDNNVVVPNTNQTPYYGFLDQLYQWEEIDDDDLNNNVNDAPLKVWSHYQDCLDAANGIVEATTLLESKEPDHAAELRQWRAEAMLMRAYMQLNLRSIFTTEYKEADIEADILAGLALIGQANEGNARRMNQRAANALAARFYLLKHDWTKVLNYTNAALGSNPAATFRPWADYQAAPTINERLTLYYDSTATANYLVEHTYSLRDRILSNHRFATNGTTMDIVFGRGPNWTNWLPAFNTNLYVWGGQEYGVWLFRAYEFFEYTDEEQGIGYVRNDYTPFTAEETLLMRAEARFYLGDTDGCLADLDLWTKSKMVTADLMLDRINQFYSRTGSIYHDPLDMAATNWSQQDIDRANSQRPLLDCLLHFRRIETIYDGLRWQDIQRYGITLTHQTRYPYASTVQTLTISPTEGYLRQMPGNEAFTENWSVNLYMKNDSTATVSMPREILFGGDETADVAAAENIVEELASAPHGWLIQRFRHAGEGMQYILDPASTTVEAGNFINLRSDESWLGYYRIVSHQENQEFVLEPIAQEKNYPETVRLVPLPTDWETYQSQCQQMQENIFSSAYTYCVGDAYLISDKQSYCFDLSSTHEATGNFKHLPFVFTPTGLRFINAEALGCSPEFIYNADDRSLTSEDLMVTFAIDWAYYLNNRIQYGQHDISVENPSSEWEQAIDELSAAISSANANYSLSNIGVGRSVDMNAVIGIIINFFSNAAKTRTNMGGVAATFDFTENTVTVSVPGLDTDELALSRNSQALVSRSESFLPALKTLLTLLQGNYTYTYSPAEGVLRMTRQGTTMTLVITM